MSSITFTQLCVSLQIHAVPINYVKLRIHAWWACSTHSVFLKLLTFPHLAEQIFPSPSPQTSPEPVNFPCFNNFLEANHVRYLPTPPISAPHRRTRSVVFSAGQGSRCPKNFRRALSGGGVRFGKLFGMAEAG